MAGPQGAVRGSGGGEMATEPSLEERLAGLDLTGEEEDDLDFSEEIEDLIKDVRWLALFKVHRPKPFSHAALFSDMRYAWKAAKEVTFKVMGENLFLAQFQCLGDWNRVMDGGPWLFRGSAVAMVEYDGFSNVHNYKLDKIPVWTRIQGIPEGLMKKKELAEKVAAKVGEAPFLVDIQEGRINPLPYLRARVFIPLERPLVRVVPITLMEKKKYLVQYEKMPTFCYVCGHIGHELTECGEGVHDVTKCQWGEWLLVKFANNIRGPIRGGGTRGGATARGRGRGCGGPREDGEEDMDIEDEQDGNDATANLQKELRGHVSGQILLIENGSTNDTSPTKLQDKKRQRKESDGTEPKNQLTATSASSSEEGRRAQ